jgi:drug/metabolite transporter (DMT)-like permease
MATDVIEFSAAQLRPPQAGRRYRFSHTFNISLSKHLLVVRIGNIYITAPRRPPPQSSAQSESSAGKHLKESRAKLIAAFAAIYIIWGSTYLGILFAIETMPPLLMAGARFSIAGLILYVWARRRESTPPTRVQWRNAAIIGALFLVGGNGGVVLAERLVPSGLAALLVATLPVFVVLIDWARPGGTNPTRGVIAGLILGVIGLVVLIGPSALHPSTGEIRLAGVALLILAEISWASGSVIAQHIELPKSAILATGMEAIAGGVILLVISLIAGEPLRFDPSAISLKSFLAFLYLIVFGSMIAFSAFVWLLKVAQPAHVATYAYVNPVVALFLGWAFAGEGLSARTLVASAIVISAVALITTARGSTR